VSHTSQRIRTFFSVAVVAAALLPVAHGQDAAPPPAAPPTATSNDSATANGPNGQGQGDTQAKSTSQSAAPGQTGKAAAVCFPLSMHCVPGTSTPASGTAPANPTNKDGTTAKDTGTAKKAPLNLNAPDVRTVVSPDELKEPLPSGDQEDQSQDADTVQVKAESNAPDVPGGFGALWWAINHPSQAWRIVAPAQ
jgi:hypothetical protein